MSRTSNLASYQPCRLLVSDICYISVPKAAALNAKLYVVHAAPASISKLLRGRLADLHVLLDELLRK
jgi:hypothetical protein